MTLFTRQLSERQPSSHDRRWLYVPYDQLSDRIGPLSREDPAELGIVLVENAWKAALRPYHKAKLVLILANQRHFALEQAARGVAVRYEFANAPFAEALAVPVDELGPLRVMEPAERELRVDLAPLIGAGGLQVIPHEGWLTTEDDFRASHPKGPPWRMDKFYRYVRKKTRILMEDGKPVGGKLSFDSDNRSAWQGDPPPPELPSFPLDEIKQEVLDLIEERFSQHPGQLDPQALPATATDATALWQWARAECLPRFGPYQDAMSLRSDSLFHTRISALLNLHRVTPRQVVDDALAVDAPIASIEGFIRQVLGWREYVRHVHRATDGFRSAPTGTVAVAAEPGDGGYERWQGESWKRPSLESDLDGGAQPSDLGSAEPLPSAFWSGGSGLNCLDHVVKDVWSTGYGHHITRLMVLANIATLVDTSPRQLTDWFWCAYADAYDWVVEPNVLGMGSYGVGELMTTKPYISGAAYINRMSDYCADCGFDPKTNCPITGLYWSFLDRHEEKLASNPRLRLPMASLRKRSVQQRQRDRAVFEWVRTKFGQGAQLRPGEVSHPKDC